MLAQFPIVPTLPARDLERAKRWYADKLKLTPTLEFPFGSVYRSGDVVFVLYVTSAEGVARHTLAAWIVSDIRAAMEELRGNGVEFEEYDLGPDGPTTQDGLAIDETGGMTAWFKDSEGNILSLIQVPEEFAVLISAT
jgi:catechol 2,3-dioxygenase-like lactoylglutathione lyase family enzyme